MVSIDFLYLSVCVGHYQTASDSTMRIVSIANITYAKDPLSCAYKNIKMYQLLVVCLKYLLSVSFKIKVNYLLN